MRTQLGGLAPVVGTPSRSPASTSAVGLDSQSDLETRYRRATKNLRKRKKETIDLDEEQQLQRVYSRAIREPDAAKRAISLEYDDVDNVLSQDLSELLVDTFSTD